MANPHPVPYSKAKHKRGCPCPACKGKQGLIDVGWSLSADIVRQLRETAEKEGRSQRHIIEEALLKYFLSS
ncbi:MAG: ribbon-helix-helix protein, CopG family [Candidatus Xenobiia bacterium LiM19]